jgi:uncharacterized protein with GYD domain
MLFVTFLTSIPGKYVEAVRVFKHPNLLPGIKIRMFLGLFGKPDALLIFEAPDESTAAEFIIQFGDVAELQTGVAFPVEDYKWTSK